MCRDGVRNRQARRAQGSQQAPLAKRACALGAEPEVVIVDEASDETAAPVMSQYPRLVAVLHDQYFATPRRFDRDGAGAPPFLRIEPIGSGRLAGPIGAHRPDAVFHGHAHHGRALGTIGTVPVHNVARPVLAGDFHHARF